jgi:FkbM family methyltransferase
MSLLDLYLKSSFRGADRATRLLAKHRRSYQLMPLHFSDSPPVYVDLRLATARDHFRRNLTSWENGIRKVMKRFVKAGSVAYDIGANMGLHTALLSHLTTSSGKVFAFEPNPTLSTALAHTCKQLGNVDLITLGLLDQFGSFEFFIPEDHTMASLHNWTGLNVQSVHIQTVTLDSLELPMPGFIKCDVEGLEFEVFRGAEKTLREAKPTVVFESYPQNADDHTAAPRFLQSLGYDLYAISRDGGLTPIESFEFEAADILAV